MRRATTIVYTHYAVHSTGVSIGWDAASVGAQLQTLCTYFGLTAATAVPAACEVTLTFLTQGQPLAIPAHACLMAQHDGLHAWQTDAQIYVSDGAVTVQLDPAAGYGIGTLLSPQGQEQPAIRKDLFLYSLLLLLRAQGFYAEHAACVATNGSGCLLVADSGSGKSTLALSLLQCGWHYLADDAILLRLRNEDVEALPLRRALYLAPDAAHAFPDTVAHWYPCPLADDAKQRLDVPALYPEQVRDTCIPRLLLFPTIVAAPQSQLVPLGKAEALLRLIRQSALLPVEPQRAPSHLDVLTRLVHQTSHYTLLAGRDLARDPRCIAPLLADLVRDLPQHTQKE